MTDSIQSPIWRIHPRHSHIEVSDLGQVRTVDHVGNGIVGRLGWHYKGHLLKQSPDTSGYPMACISPNMVGVHKLVTETFIGPCPDGMEVLHLDTDRSNPSLTNLRYGTRSENQLQRVMDGNHYLRNRTECPRGHKLQSPNLVPYGIREGKRQCLSCAKARGWCYLHPEDRADFNAIADRRYSHLK